MVSDGAVLPDAEAGAVLLDAEAGAVLFDAEAGAVLPPDAEAGAVLPPDAEALPGRHRGDVESLCAGKNVAANSETQKRERLNDGA
jgi:hypothetical protein